MNQSIVFSVVIAALGYFVDIYDLLIFSVVRVQSLKDLGLAGDSLTDASLFLLNAQMAGMLIGGLVWGVLGDRQGRLSVLWGSILLYSLANIGNAFVFTVPQYAFLRFLAGIGLAGELGAGITLVAETLPKQHRGLGTALVATVGVAGGVVASLVGDLFSWKTAYIVGGSLGLALFTLRMTVHESGLFQNMQKEHIAHRGDLRALFLNSSRLRRYVLCVLLGIPLWFIVGLVMTFAPEIGKALKFSEEIKTSGAIFWFYGGLVAGDLISGLLSQYLRSRRKALLIFILGSSLGVFVLLQLPEGTLAQTFYFLSGITGIFAGYWALFVTVAAESFGTNLRATVATSVPNMVRGATIPLTVLFSFLKPHLGFISSLNMIAVLVFSAALISLYGLKETFSTDLDFVEK